MIDVCGGGVTDQKKDQEKKLFQEHLGRLYATLNSAEWLLANFSNRKWGSRLERWRRDVQKTRIHQVQFSAPTSVGSKLTPALSGHYTFDLPGHCTHTCKSHHLPRLCNLKIKAIKKSKCETNYNKVSLGASPFRGEAYTGSLLQFTTIQGEGVLLPRSQLRLDGMWPSCLVPSTSSANTWPATMAQCTSHQARWPESYPQTHMVDGFLQSGL